MRSKMIVYLALFFLILMLSISYKRYKFVQKFATKITKYILVNIYYRFVMIRPYNHRNEINPYYLFVAYDRLYSNFKKIKVVLCIVY